MTTRAAICEYLKSHGSGTFKQLREHCEKTGVSCSSGGISFCMGDMLNRGEVERIGKPGKYVYSPTERLKEEIPRTSRETRIPQSNYSKLPAMFDRLLRGVRG